MAQRRTGTGKYVDYEKVNKDIWEKPKVHLTEVETFEEFYPLYLQEHKNRTNRRLHFMGSTLGLLCFITMIAVANIMFLPLGLAIGYGFAWVGHFFFEKNKPATFQRPLWSFMGDWVMWKDILIGNILF
jgi:hypothetical protein